MKKILEPNLRLSRVLIILFTIKRTFIFCKIRTTLGLPGLLRQQQLIVTRINPQTMMLGQEPHKTTSNLSHMNKPYIQPSIIANSSIEKMLLNLQKKKCTDGPTLERFDTHSKTNEVTVQETVKNAMPTLGVLIGSGWSGSGQTGRLQIGSMLKIIYPNPALSEVRLVPVEKKKDDGSHDEFVRGKYGSIKFKVERRPRNAATVKPVKRTSDDTKEDILKRQKIGCNCGGQNTRMLACCGD
ncbi:26S proteasome non-ATPase regulatory subunit 14 [Artemisia annua]|uniref:26S proteasome non-ATPase regulatory subunit 14 n=1 Tax=Artemisia annua TaxID=35608 RepID=A0A2U1N343_ARTAN|nr:26S proteasome non-ATPase regulatory subunit 14 [Artemisia annua]